MTEIEDLCSRVERERKDVEVSNLCVTLRLQSTTYCFLKKLEEHQDFKRLVKLVQDRDNEAILLRRATKIWTSSFDSRYENPDDTFLAIYIYALSKVEDHNDDVWTLICEIATPKTGHFFHSRSIAQHLLITRYGDAMRVEEGNVVRVRCRVCGGLFLDKEVATYKYTSRYVGDGTTSAPKLFSLCRDCLQRGLDTLNGKK